MKNTNRIIIIFLIIILFSFLIHCSDQDKTTITINLDNMDQVANVVARLKIANDKYIIDDTTSMSDTDRKEMKESSKEAVNKILAEYGIDTEDEISIFAKAVQKYSYNKDFNSYLNKLLQD